jgi:DNA-binding NarL/FixJ family response regulator
MTGPAEPSAVKLTLRQQEVLRQIVQGRRVREIAESLDLPFGTVEAIKLQMMHEFNVQSTAELVEYTIQHGLLAK